MADAAKWEAQKRRTQRKAEKLRNDQPPPPPRAPAAAVAPMSFANMLAGPIARALDGAPIAEPVRPVILNAPKLTDWFPRFTGFTNVPAAETFVPQLVRPRELIEEEEKRERNRKAQERYRKRVAAGEPPAKRGRVAGTHVQQRKREPKNDMSAEDLDILEEVLDNIPGF